MVDAVTQPQAAIADGIAENELNPGGSFFETLGALFGELAGQLQENMISKGEDMQANQGADDGSFAQAQSEFQAAQQEFSMFMEVVSTSLKSIGQAAQTMARQN